MVNGLSYAGPGSGFNSRASRDLLKLDTTCYLINLIEKTVFVWCVNGHTIRNERWQFLIGLSIINVSGPPAFTPFS